MAYEVVATPEFEGLLERAVSFRIDSYGLRSARRLLDAVDASAELLAKSPRMGSLVDRDEEAPAPDALRWTRVDSYIAVYRVHDEDATIALLFLFHATSNWRSRVLAHSHAR